MHFKKRTVIFLILFFITILMIIYFKTWKFTEQVAEKRTHSPKPMPSLSNVLRIDLFTKSFFNLPMAMSNKYTTLNKPSTNVKMDKKKSLSSSRNATDFLINTRGCKIPAIKPFLNEGFKFKINRTSFKCPGLKRLTRISKGRIELINSVNKNYFNNKVSYCILQLIHRVEGNDDKFEYGPEIVFNNSARFTGEFCIVNCFSKTKKILQIDFHSKIYEKEKIKSKIQRVIPNGLLNIHLFGIDSTSRNSFIRQMPRLREYLLKNMRAYEYPGLNKVGYNTLPNVIPLLTGKHLAEIGWKVGLPFDDFDYIWKKYSARGAITLLAEDRPRTGAFNFRRKGFFHSPTDYYIRPLTLAIAAKKRRNNFCVGSVSETEYILEYTRDFLEKFQDKFYFAFDFFTDWSHDDLNGSARWENVILEFFIWLQESGKLNNTILFFFGDHGFQMGGFRDTKTGKYESSLPFAFLVVPEWFKKKYPGVNKALETNQKRLVTFFDVYATMMENLNGIGSNSSKTRLNKSERGMSLMTPISLNRTCQKAGIPISYCQCIFKKEKIDLNHVLVKKAALAMVDSMNKIIKKKAKGKCAVLTLHNLIDAYKDSADSKYLVTFSVLPSFGQFESIAWLKPNTEKFEILTEAIRINRYGNQSKCVKDLSLIMICYCI